MKMVVTSFVTLAILCMLPNAPLMAQTWRTINSGAWSDPANWGGTLPTNDGTADITFSQIGSPIKTHGFTTLDLDWNIHSVYWNPTSLDSGKAVINNPVPNTGTLAIQNGLTNGSGGIVEIDANVILGAVQTWNDTSVSSLNGPGTYVYGSISGPGGILKTGSGTLTLGSQSNSYGGGTTVSGGALEVRGAGSLGPGAVQVNNAILRFAPFPLTAFSSTMTQNLTIGSVAATIQTRNGTLIFAGTIDGPGQLKLDYDNTWPAFTQARYILSNPNSYGGGTVIGMATVTVSGTNQSLGTGAVNLQSGAVLELNSESNLAPGQKVAVQLGSVLVLNNPSINPANLIDQTLQIPPGGTLALTGSSFGTVLSMATLGNGQLFLGSAGSNVTYIATALSAGTGGIYRLGGGSVADISSTPSLTFAGTDNLFTGANSMIVGSSAGFESGDARGASTVVLQNPNNYSGGTTIIGGSLLVGNDASLGTGPLIFGGSITLGGALGGQGGAHTLSNAVIFNNPVSGSQFSIVGTRLTFTGTVDLGGLTRILVGNLSSGTTTFTNTIGNGTLNLDRGRWALQGNNTFSGGLLISDGAIVDVGNDGNLGATGGSLTFQNGTLHPIDSFTTNHPIIVSQYNGSIMTNSQTLTLAGPVSGSGTLTKGDAGTLIFSGANKNPGGLNITGGTFELLNTGSTSGFSTTVGSGAFLTGNGSAGSTIVMSGANLAPGTTTPGTFTFNSRLDLSGGSILDFDLGLTLSDLVVVNHGTLEKWSGGSASPVLVNIFDAGGLAVGQTYTLFDWSQSGSASISGTDFKLGSSPVFGTFFVSNKTLRFTTTVPEPSSFLLFGIGVSLLLFKRHTSR